MFLESNENEEKCYLNIGTLSKTVLIGKFIATQAHIKKQTNKKKPSNQQLDCTY